MTRIRSTCIPDAAKTEAATIFTPKSAFRCHNGQYRSYRQFRLKTSSE